MTTPSQDRTIEIVSKIAFVVVFTIIVGALLTGYIPIK